MTAAIALAGALGAVVALTAVIGMIVILTIRGTLPRHARHRTRLIGELLRALHELDVEADRATAAIDAMRRRLR